MSHTQVDVCVQVPVPEKMVASVLTLLISSQNVQPNEQLLQLGVQDTGANQVQTKKKKTEV